MRAFFFGLIFTIMAGVSSSLAALIVPLTCGGEFELSSLSEGGFTSDDACALRALNVVNQAVLFLGSSLVFVLLFGFNIADRFRIHTPALNTLLVPLLALFSLPLIQAAYEVNQALIPEDGMISKLAGPAEDLAGEMTNAILTMPDTYTLLINLFVVALVPAICEEIAFRGVLQSQLAKVTRNPHVAIWLTAFVFSFVHFQFYGFIPRMLLGAFFGYLVVHSGSIWAAVLAHFINNAAAVLSKYLYDHYPNVDLEAIENPGEHALVIVVGCIGFTLLFWAYLHRSAWPSIRDEYLDPKVKKVG